MSFRLLLAAAVCLGAGFIGGAAIARPVTTDDCLKRGLCAYVSPHGRVTCGKCPGQAHAVSIPAGAKALCMDDSWAKGGACSGHGGVKVPLKR